MNHLARPAAFLPCPRCGGLCEAAFCPNDGAKVNQDPYIGACVANDIVLTRLLGTGAMGRVYLGYQRGVGREVAVKILRHSASKNPDVFARFQREAKIASSLRHPNVVEIYGAGELLDGSMYIVMEHLGGITLGEDLESSERGMSVERALGILLPLCDAVGEAHAHGVIHRDLKPDNVMLVRRGDQGDFVKILDFGIAKDALDSHAAVSLQGAIFGTPKYISPEAAQGLGVSPASDVYSLAAMLFEMLTGAAPFDANEAMGYFCKHMSMPPPDVRTVAPRAVPDAIARVVMANLAKIPANRASDARAFGNALAAAAKIDGVIIPDAGTVARLSQPGPGSNHVLDETEVSTPLALTLQSNLYPGTNPNSTRKPLPSRGLGLAAAFVLGVLLTWLGVVSLSQLHPVLAQSTLAQSGRHT